VEDEVHVLGKKLVEHRHELRCLPDHHLDAAPPRLLRHVVGDR
jgi:hypothetical protein